MGFVVLPALATDISDVYNAYFQAFKTNPITTALFPHASAEDMTNPESEFRKGHTAHTQTWWQEGAKTQYTLKCVDSSTGKIAGMALWDVYLTPSDWKKGEIGWLQGEEKERAESLIMPLWETRAKLWDNERYVYCHVVAVAPEYQKKGVGKLLVDFGIEVARQARLPIYCESSQEGLRLYEQKGFKHLVGALKKKETGFEGQEGGEEDVPLLVWVPEGAQEELPKAVQQYLK